MPRKKAVLPTVAMAALLLAVCLSLQGCDDPPAKADSGPDLRQELRQERQRREAAEMESRLWQTRGAWMGGAVALALVVGAALGSRARRDAERAQSHDDTP